MKRNILLVCLFALIIVLFACSRSITGIYVSIDNPDMCLKLDPDGTFSLEKDGKHLSGEYEMEDNIITLEFLAGRMAIKNNAVITIFEFEVETVREVKIYGNTIMDDKGKKWIKQREDN